MNNLILTILVALSLSGCGQSQSPTSVSNKGFNPIGGNGGNGAQCALTGVYVNQSDGVQASLTTLNGLCRLQLSCGAAAWLFDQGGNQWMVLMETSLGDGPGGCGYPAQYTSYADTNGVNHSGMFYNATFGFYAGIGFQGGFMPSQLNHPWVKQ